MHKQGLICRYLHSACGDRRYTDLASTYKAIGTNPPLSRHARATSAVIGPVSTSRSICATKDALVNRIARREKLSGERAARDMFLRAARPLNHMCRCCFGEGNRLAGGVQPIGIPATSLSAHWPSGRHCLTRT